MERGIDRALIAKVGAVVFAWALSAPVVLADATAQRSEVSVASVASDDVLAAIVLSVTPATAARVLAPDTIADAAQVPQLPVRTAVLARASAALVGAGGAGSAVPPLPPRRADPPPEALIRDGIVLASWYGPGFYGRRTACGQTYTPEIIGVAHRLLRCGTLITITSPRGKTLTVPVIDRGPYIAGRALDLSNATRLALQCTDLCHVRMTVLQ